MSDLFSDAARERIDEVAPLASRLRPRTLEEFVGQEDVLGEGTALRLAIAEDRVGSMILYGPPGSGKTTLARIVAETTGAVFEELSAVSASVADVRAVLARARESLGAGGRRSILFLDEIHRFTKAQQDALLPGVENRWIVLVAATTENPSFSIIAPLLSRSLLLTLRSLEDDDIRDVIRRAVTDEHGLAGEVDVDDHAMDHLVRTAVGDARRALTALEAAAGAAIDREGPDAPRPVTVHLNDAEAALDRAAVRYDRAGDQHYDVASALIKSMRGSDVDASLHYLARMLEAGEDPRFVARRIVIAASEDVGMADPSALQTAVAAMHAVAQIGMPEARIVLAQAVVHLALAPKSNAAYRGINAAIADIREGLGGAVPAHLRGTGYAGAKRLGHGEGYRYPHDDELGVVAQQYAPDDVAGREYYEPTDRGLERELAARLARIRQILHGG